MNTETRYKHNPLPDIALNPVVVGIEQSVIHALLCSTDHGILMTDPHGNDIVSNPRFGELFDVDYELVVRSSRDEVRNIAVSRVKDPVAFRTLLERTYSDPTLEFEDEIELITTPPRILRRYTAPVYDSRRQNIGRLWTFQDVTENRRLQRDVEYYAKELQKQYERQKEDFQATTEALEAMTAISSALATCSDLDGLLCAITEHLSPFPGHESAAVLIRQGKRPGQATDRLAGYVRRKGEEAIRADLPLDCDPLLVRALNANGVLHADGLCLYQPASEPITTLLQSGCLSLAAIHRDQKVIGLLLLGSSREDPPQSPPPASHLLTHLMAIRDQVALALETHQLHNELQTAYDDLRAAQAQMVESAKLGAVGTLAAGIAHDIRNIMTPLQMELAMAGHSSTVMAARAQLDRLSALTHRLLSLSRPVTVHPGPLDLRDVITRIRPLIQPQADVENVSIDLKFARKLPPVQGDGGRLEHLFINLLLNALNAMSAHGGKLTVTAIQEADTVRIDVKDTGKGVTPENLPRLFEPFFTTRANGTGLGLFSAKRIVEEHKGRIAVKSVSGRGTCFSVWLPLAEARDLQEGRMDGRTITAGG